MAEPTAEELAEERVAALVEEYLEGLRSGHGMTQQGFIAAHPEAADALRELLPALTEVESLGRATAPAAVSMSAFPETLGGYRLVERIGAGGMGTVFRATEESLHREVAVKILSPAWNADAQHCAAFENESRVIAQLRHTNIVEIYGAGQEGNYRYYVMSLVDGQGITPALLRKAYAEVPYEQAVAQVGLQAARALAFAHSRHILHRDVKPGNLLLDAAGVVHVGDFGLATVLNHGEEAPLVTQSHDGTLRYMAPERLNKGENTYACDQYSLGLTLYELLTKRPAFLEAEPGALIRRICAEPLPPLSAEGELGAIINKSISYEPADRYASMEAMAADLERYLKGEPVVARPASRLRRYAMWCRRRPAVAAWSHVAAAALALLLVSVSAGYVRERESLAKENELRLRAEKNERIADASLQRLFDSMMSRSDGSALQPTKADARLLQELMPYYEEVLEQGGDSEEKMAAACTTLATIALQTGDFATAEVYFARAAELHPAGSAAALAAVNGWVAALRGQGSRPKREEAAERLRKAIEAYTGTEDFDTQRELVRSLRLAGEHGRRGGHHLHEQESGKKALVAAAQLLSRLLSEHPDHPQLRLRQVEMLGAAPFAEVRYLLAPEGQTPIELLDSLIRDFPDNEAYRRAYVNIVALPPRRHEPHADAAMLLRAGDYARTLLADHPADTGLLLQYLNVRDRYATALASQGKAAEAARENEMTLGVLSLLTSRSDFSPEMRMRLVMLVSMHPEAEDAKSQQQAEISLLLQSYDEERLKDIRTRLKNLRAHMPRRSGSPRKPPSAPGRMPH
ncbi:MAG: serine/threonine protein kinase [Akkermansia sp.]|nr:serine/threonine protein kinase [Akkermansia sp.]